MRKGGKGGEAPLGDAFARIVRQEEANVLERVDGPGTLASLAPDEARALSLAEGLRTSVHGVKDRLEIKGKG